MPRRPASLKQRGTNTAMSWFYDPYSESDDNPLWRPHPTDLAHRAVYAPDVDEETGEPLGQEKRAYERKGWVPADVALKTIPGARNSLADLDSGHPVARLAKRLGVKPDAGA